MFVDLESHPDWKMKKEIRGDSLRHDLGFWYRPRIIWFGMYHTVLAKNRCGSILKNSSESES